MPWTNRFLDVPFSVIFSLHRLIADTHILFDFLGMVTYLESWYMDSRATLNLPRPLHPRPPSSKSDDRGHGAVTVDGRIAARKAAAVLDEGQGHGRSGGRGVLGALLVPAGGHLR